MVATQRLRPSCSAWQDPERREGKTRQGPTIPRFRSITAFGTGIGEDFDVSKIRYHKCVLMADDVDGQQYQNPAADTFIQVHEDR